MQKSKNLLFSFILLFLLTLQINVNAQSDKIDHESNENYTGQNSSVSDSTTSVVPNTENDNPTTSTRKQIEYETDGSPTKAEIDDIATKDPMTGKKYSDFLLELRNYPNPVVDKTTIVYTLEKNMTVSLAIYDSSGNLIQQLRNQTQQYVETYHVVFDATGLETGIYFCVLTMNDETKEIKILVQ